MNHLKTLSLLLLTTLIFSCQEKPETTSETNKELVEEFDYNVTEFADIGVLRYQIPGWQEPSHKNRA